MGIYTDSITKRNKQDMQLEAMADKSLENNLEMPIKLDFMDEVQIMLKDILEHFGIIQETWIYYCKNIDDLLDCMLDPLEIMYDKENITVDSLKDKSEIILAISEDNHAVALFPSLFGYRYVCPGKKSKGRVKTSSLKLKDVAYVIHRPIRNNGHAVSSLLSLMWKLITPKDYIPLIVSTAAVTLLGLVIPALNKYVLSILVPMGDEATTMLILLALVYITAGCIRSFFTTIKSLFLTKTKLSIAAKIQSALMANILFKPQSFFTDSSTGRLSVKIRNSTELAETVVDFFLNSLLTLVLSLSYIPQMIAYAPVLYVPALSALVLQIAFSLFAAASLYHNKQNLLDFQSDTNNFVFQSIKGIQKIKSIGATHRIYAKWADLYRNVIHYNLNPPYIVMLKEKIISLISSLATVVILSVAVSMSVKSADYIAFNASYGLVISAVLQITDIMDAIIGIKPILKQIEPLIDKDDSQENVKEYVRNVSGDINVENLSFFYPKASKKCLDGVSFSVKKGEKIAIVGASGCGKSSLIKLLLGLEDPDNGQIYYGQMPLNNLNLRSLRKRIGSVLQFSRLLPGSIYDNISFSKSSLTYEEVRDSAYKAGVLEDIDALPLGFDTDISDSNSGGFSGGQKQRILLARAFASKPKILILDEATSALDNITQDWVLNSIYEMKCTVIMVAHRLSTVKSCDRIMVLKDGHIAEMGTYQELLDLNGEFAKLVAKQRISNLHE